MKKLIGIGLQIFLVLFSISSFAEPCQLGAGAFAANCSENHTFAPTNSTSPQGGAFFVPLSAGLALMIVTIGATAYYFRQKNDQPEYMLLPQWQG